MPLPAALAARLARRGIISKEQAKRESRSVAPDEEVFAESYDDADGDARDGRQSTGGDPFRINRKIGEEKKEASSAREKLLLGHPGCPNKWNAYHECSTWCVTHWGLGKTEPDPEYLAKYKAMMRKYGPLPEGWKEHYDPGTGRHYFWCNRTDRVSWLPPGHPKAKIMEAASALREMLQSQMKAAAKAAAFAAAATAAQKARNRDDSDDDDDDDADEDDDDDDQAMDLDSDMDSEEGDRGGGDDDNDDDNESREIEERRIREKERRREEHERYRGKAERVASKRQKPADKLDPMDPAAYSDAPRGNWSSGLEKAQDN